MAVPFEGTYYWSTIHPHCDNMVTMGNYLDEHLPEGFEIVMEDGTYAEVMDEDGSVYALHASGNGDSFNHKMTCEAL